MTLNKKLNIWLMSGLLLVFLSVAVVIFCIERQYYRMELNCSVQNIEISLGVVLARPLYTKDNQLIESLINQIFDQGVLYLLQVRGANNELLISQNKKIIGHYVPRWFVDLIRWPSQLQSITVMYDKKSVGRLMVSADPSYAYEAMWKTFLVLLFWYCFWVVISLVAIHFCSKQLAESLHRFTDQTNALGSRQFVIETQLPNTMEFKKVALAMNQSVTELKKIFKDQLRNFELVRTCLFQDKLTEFGNHRYFIYQLSSLLYRDEGFVPGFIIGVVIAQFAEFKEQFGEINASQFIKDTASLCLDFWRSYPDLNIAQIESGHFALIIKENDELALIKKCEEFSQEMQKMSSNYANLPIAIAVVSYQSYHEQALLLSEFNQTLAHAKNESNNLAFSPNLSTHHQLVISRDEFKNLLENELEYLRTQPVSNGTNIFHQELTISIPFNEEVFDGNYLMPMARATGLSQQLDFFVLSQVCEKDLFGKQVIAFTLSDLTLSEEPLLEKCLKQLRALSSEHRSRLNFEVNECVVYNNFARIVGFFNELHHLGIKLGVKQAGIHFTTMDYLNELPLSYLKLHGSLSHEIDENKEFILHYFHEIANIFAVEMIATEVQNQKEWDILEGLGVRWGQGGYFNSLK